MPLSGRRAAVSECLDGEKGGRYAQVDGSRSPAGWVPLRCDSEALSLSAGLPIFSLLPLFLEYAKLPGTQADNRAKLLASESSWESQVCGCGQATQTLSPTGPVSSPSR